MSASQNNLSLVLNQQDANGTNILNRLIGAIAYAGIVGVFRDSILTDNSSHVQTLPTATVLQYYFKNTHATAKITVTWTPNGDSSHKIMDVGPGGVLIFWMTASNTNGITALTYQSDTANATFEDFLGG